MVWHCVRSGWQALALGTMGTGTLVHSFGSMYLSPDDYLQWLGMSAGKLQTNDTAKAQRHALCEYMPLRPCAIYDLCKIRFTARVGGGITAIYHCVVIHSAFELGLWRQSYDIFAK